MNNQQVCHIWANQLKPSGRGSNLFFEKDTIYSYGYHFPMAKILDENTILVSPLSYSNSTSKHQNYMMQAISHKRVIYGLISDYRSYGIIDNIEYYTKKIKDLFYPLRKARKPEKYLSQIYFYQQRCKDFLSYFKAKPSPELKELLNFTSKIDITLYQEKTENKILAKGKKHFNIWLKNFRAFKDNKDSNLDNRAINFYLNRLGDPVFFQFDGKAFFSSKGIQIEKDILKRYLLAYLNNQIKVGSKIIGYPVHAIKKDFIQIGCHNIYKSEIEYLTKILN